MRVVFALLALVGCEVTGEFVCATSAQCRRGATIGYCEQGGLCSFIDPTCPSHHRYADSIGEAGGECVANVVSGRVWQRYAVNDSTFAPVLVERVPPASELSVAVVLDNGTRPAVDTRDDGTFAFAVGSPGQAYEVTTMLDGSTDVLQHSAPHLELVQRRAGRIDRVPITSAQTITRFQMSNSPAGETIIATTGLWSDTDTGTGSSFDHPWTTAVWLGGSGLLEAPKHDRVYVVKRGDMTTYLGIVAVSQHSFSTVQGMTNQVIGAFPPISTDQCKRVIVDQAAERARLATALPNRTPTYSARWDIRAFPAPTALGLYGGIQTVVGDSVTTPAMLDTNASFLNPFVGHELVAQSFVGAQISVSPPTGGSGVILFAGVEGRALFDAGAGCASTARPASTIAAPTNVNVGTTTLDTDGELVTIDRTRPVRITWAPTSGTDIMYLFELRELVADGNGVGSSNRVRDVSTATPSVFIDPSIFVVGRGYIISIIAQSGWPQGTAGNFEPLSLPRGTIETMTSTFIAN